VSFLQTVLGLKSAANSVKWCLLLASAKEGLFYRLQFIVGQIFSIYAIDHKQLYVLKQAVIAPERFWQLLIWLKASLISMSERLSSICTKVIH
jgi:hypothetical protein